MVWSSVGLVDGLLALAEAAVGVLSSGEGRAPALGAAAAAEAAQRAEVRRLSRRFLLLFASHLRDSHVLEHCARSAVMAAVGGRVVGAADGCSARREAAEEPGQGQAQAQRQGQGLERVPSDRGSVFLRSLLSDLTHFRIHAKALVEDCMRAPAPASTLIGPAVNQALNGPAFVHLELVLGLHALCTADGGPEYGMPVSYRALPAAWKPRRTVEWEKQLTADVHVQYMVDALSRLELRERCMELLGGVGPMLTLQLRACELAAWSAEVHGEGEGEEQWRSGQEERGGAGRTLRHVMTPKAAVHIGFDAHYAAHCLLEECWDQQQRRRAAAQGTGGCGEREAESSSRLSGLQGGNASEAGEAAGREEGGAAGERGGAQRRTSGEPEAAGVRSGGGAGREGPDATAVNASVPPDGPGDTAEAASNGDVAAGLGAGEAGGTAGAADPSPAVQAAGALSRGCGRAAGPGWGGRRPLSPAALQAFQVRWWRSVCRAAEHMVTLRLGPEERTSVEALGHGLAGWLRLDELRLPDLATGRYPGLCCSRWWAPA